MGISERFLSINYERKPGNKVKDMAVAYCKNELKWKCSDLKCLRKPTIGAGLVYNTPCKQIQPLSRKAAKVVYVGNAELGSTTTSCSVKPLC